MTLVQAIINFLGSYAPLTGDYYLWDEVSQTTVKVVQPIPGIAGVNWPWILAATLLVISVYSLFRLISCLFKG